MVRTGVIRLVVAAAFASAWLAGSWSATPWSAVPALAQEFPARPISIIVGVAPGGITDVSTRIYADAVARSIGQKIVVENRPVGGGTVAAVAVQNAPPDGYTLLTGRLRPGEGFHPGDAAVPDAGAAGRSARQSGEVGRRPA
jgi:tripartite-type tricarboxylate transporter receptor subunit TctC